jgi:1-deoxyxylulose-5-phosphate synthase
MEYVNLGRTGLKVSRLCLGCMTYGEPDRGNHPWTLGEEQSRPFIQRALELGINFFDTANVYSAGSSEEIVGRALHDFTKRDEVVIATKVYPAHLRTRKSSGDMMRKLSVTLSQNVFHLLGTSWRRKPSTASQKPL